MNEDYFDQMQEAAHEADFFGREYGQEVCEEFYDESEPREDHFRDDVEADADALAGAGYGTDEDYGYYGGDEYWYDIRRS